MFVLSLSLSLCLYLSVSISLSLSLCLSRSPTFRGSHIIHKMEGFDSTVIQVSSAVAVGTGPHIFDRNEPKEEPTSHETT